MCSDLYIDASNYLAELTCTRMQQKNDAGVLPIKFWNHPKYKNLYIREVSQAKILLKKYPAQAIIKALEHWEARYILSLRNHNLIPIIEKIVPTLEATEFIETKTVESKSSKPVKNKPNIMDLL